MAKISSNKFIEFKRNYQLEYLFFSFIGFILLAAGGYSLFCSEGGYSVLPILITAVGGCTFLAGLLCFFKKWKMKEVIFRNGLAYHSYYKNKTLFFIYSLMGGLLIPLVLVVALFFDRSGFYLDETDSVALGIVTIISVILSSTETYRKYKAMDEYLKQNNIPS